MNQQKLAVIRKVANEQFVNYAGSRLNLGAGADYGLVKNKGRAGGYYGYDGSMDEFVNFDGQSDGTFNNEINTHRSFQLTFDSTDSPDDVEMILFPSIYPTPAIPVVTDGVVDLGGGNSIEFSGIPQDIAMLQAWINAFPTRVTGMKINSENQLQHGTTIDILPKNPWRKNTEVRTIYFEHHTTEYKNQLTLSTIKEQFQVDPKTEVRFTFKANTTGTVTIFFGAVMDTSEALKMKAAAAGAQV